MMVSVEAQTKVEGAEVGDERVVEEAEVQTRVGVGQLQTFFLPEKKILLAQEIIYLVWTLHSEQSRSPEA